MSNSAVAVREVSATTFGDGNGFASAVRAGLGHEGRKSLPSQYLYDEVGSALFEVITALPEYGVTRAEDRVLARHARTLASVMQPEGERSQPLRVIELGSGTGRKTRWILEALAQSGPLAYCPIDISGSALSQCCSALNDIAGVDITPFEGGYLPGLSRAVQGRGENERVLVLFLGSTIGNFTAPAAQAFLQSVQGALRSGDALLLGTDMLKPIPALLAAYDDPIGVTAAFNLNLLARMNRELNAGFRIEEFEHVAKFNPQAGSVEMHLRARHAQHVAIPGAGLSVSFTAGETIWTESSHKYRTEDIATMARLAGFDLGSQWLDKEWPFAETLMTVP